MIFDRTQEHIIRSKQIFSSKIKKGIALTKDDLWNLERGFLTADTINRIIGKEKELYQILVGFGYPVNDLFFLKDIFSKGDFFMDENFHNLFENAAALEKAFYGEKSNIVGKIKKTYHYESINKIEKFLHDLEADIVGVVK